MIGVAGLVVHLDGRRVLDGVDLEVPAGAWVTVLGPNGAGKSTLLRAVAGLVPAVGGVVEVGGERVDHLRRRSRARRLAFVPQAPTVPPGMDVASYVLLGRTPHLAPLGREGRSDLAAVERALAALELGPVRHRALATLSGGERQRAFLARALAQEAAVLLLDEPTTSLDVGHQQDVLELVDGLRRSGGLTVLSTMHDLTLAGQYAERLVLLAEGRVVAAGPVADVLAEPWLSQVFGASVRVTIDDAGLPVVVPARRPARVGS